MKNFFIVMLSAATLVACERHEGPEAYYVRFAVKEAGVAYRNTKVIPLAPQVVGGNSLRDQDEVAVGFGFRSAFKSASDPETYEDVTFYVSTLVPLSELRVDSGTYRFKNFSTLAAYLPTGNLFADEAVHVSTYFYRGLYCWAQLDTTFRNAFHITSLRCYVDEDGAEAFDPEGKFTARYEPICNKSGVELQDGTFRIKLLPSKIQ